MCGNLHLIAPLKDSSERARDEETTAPAPTPHKQYCTIQRAWRSRDEASLTVIKHVHHYGSWSWWPLIMSMEGHSCPAASLTEWLLCVHWRMFAKKEMHHRRKSAAGLIYQQPLVLHYHSKSHRILQIMQLRDQTASTFGILLEEIFLISLFTMCD